MKLRNMIAFTAGLCIPLVACFPVDATEKKHGNPDVRSHSESRSYSGSASRSDSVADSNSTATAGDSQSQVSIGDVGNGAVTGGDVTIRHKRNAPSVGVYGSPSTAEFMTCFGVGGSAKEGAATGIWCRLQKELYAEHRADKYAAGGNPARAAQAYCSRKLHWQDFGTYDGCLTEMEVIYIGDVPRETLAVVAPEVEYMVASATEDPDYEALRARVERAEAEARQAVARAQKAAREAEKRSLEAQARQRAWQERVQSKLAEIKPVEVE